MESVSNISFCIGASLALNAIIIHVFGVEAYSHPPLSNSTLI